LANCCRIDGSPNLATESEFNLGSPGAYADPDLLLFVVENKSGEIFSAKRVEID
jgi:hypothetical protein